ncbi:MAG: Gfo/Idh/MocA family protein [Solirubrobacteraceae bacterium]
MPEIGVATAHRGTEGREPSTIGVGMLGYSFMGRAHVNAYRTLPYMAAELPLAARLVAIAGRDEHAVAAAARRFGFERWETDWHALIADESIQLFDNGGPNAVHAEPTIAAAQAGKHVICEKPLGRTADEGYEIWRRVEATGVKAMCAFNYRFVPAVRLARRLIESGEIGEIYHFRGRYLQDWLADPRFPMVWRLSKEAAGSGALGDLGAHVIDLARYLVGEIATIAGSARTFVTDRPGGRVDVDDAVEAVVEFEGGAVGTIEATRFAVGRKNGLSFEINGSKGSIAFDLERLNELSVHLSGSSPGAEAQGFRQVMATEPGHPYLDMWWPPGHIIGWEHTFAHEVLHLLTAIATDGPIGPHGATFEDGYRAAEVCDALLRASETGQRQTLTFRGAGS